MEFLPLKNQDLVFPTNVVHRDLTHYKLGTNFAFEMSTVGSLVNLTVKVEVKTLSHAADQP